MQLMTDDRTWAELDSTELVDLNNIAEADAGLPSAQAQGVLKFFYDYNFELDLDLGEAVSNSELGTSDLLESTQTSVAIYPNPARDLVSFRFGQPLKDDTTLKLININGKVIATFPLKVGDLELKMNTTDYPVGTYFYELTLDGNKEIGKIILMK